MEDHRFCFKKQSDLVWKRFISACDAFFDAKSKQFKERKSEEQVNLDKKKELIEKIQTLDTATDTKAAGRYPACSNQRMECCGACAFLKKRMLCINRIKQLLTRSLMC